MNILLIEPPSQDKSKALRILGSLGTVKADFVWPPLDLMIIAGFLRKYKIHSEILDANALGLSMDETQKEIKKYNPDMVIFTTSTSTINTDLEIAKISKEVSEKINTVAIGTHAFATRQELSENKYLDYVSAHPEPEGWLPNILKNFHSLQITNLDELGFPVHDKLNLKLYRDPFQKRSPMTITYGSRGCRWGKCIYCSCPAFFQPLRKRSIESIIEELKWIISLGIREVKWFDAELNCDINWLNELCREMIKNKIDLTWSANVRADCLPINTIKLMKTAGCHTLHIGVESGDNEILKNIRKGITVHQVKESVKNIKDTKIKVVTYFMLGLPGETKETMKKTFNLAKELNPDATTFSIATPHPGTYFYDWIEKNNLFITKDFNKFNPCLPPVFNLNDLSSEEIYEFMKNAYRNFYFRPSYIFKKIIKTRKFIELRNGIKNFLFLIQKYGFREKK